MSSQWGTIPQQFLYTQSLLYKSADGKVGKSLAHKAGGTLCPEWQTFWPQWGLLHLSETEDLCTTSYIRKLKNSPPLPNLMWHQEMWYATVCLAPKLTSSSGQHNHRGRFRITLPQGALFPKYYWYLLTLGFSPSQPLCVSPSASTGERAQGTSLHSAQCEHSNHTSQRRQIVETGGEQ